MKRIAITGASGFIGTALVNALTARGHSVVGLDQHAPGPSLKADTFIQADIRDRAALQKAFQGAEIVHHLAALPSIARAPELEYWRINVEGTRAALETAQNTGVAHFIHMSSSTVYGSPDHSPLRETTALAPRNPYSRTKAAAEEAVQLMARRAIPCTIIRPRVVVGNGRAGIFALLFHFLSRDLPIPLPNGGRNRFQFTAVEDLVEAAIAASEVKPGASCPIYNIGSDVVDPLHTDLKRLIDFAGSRSRIIPLPATPMRWGLEVMHRLHLSPLVPEQHQILARDFVLDTTLAREKIGFTPRHANSDGLLAAWTWWKTHLGPGGMRELMSHWKMRHQNSLQRRGGL